jgi:predicted transposase YbfD/YdcC
LPKKTLEHIVSSGNHYIVQVKGNQKKLLGQIKKNTCEDAQCTDFFVDLTQKRGRTEMRKTFIYKNISGISDEWAGLKRLIRVERYVYKKEKISHETAYYMSDVVSNKAKWFAIHIRSHWGIENRLHWVKDVVMKEDASKIKTGAAPENISIIRNIVCNIFRGNGFDSIKYAIEQHANDFKELYKLITSNRNRCKTT